MEHFGTPCSEIWEGCPHCESWSFVETFECDHCGEYITGKYKIVEDEYGEIKICESCYGEIVSEEDYIIEYDITDD